MHKVITAVITPFTTTGAIDYDHFRRLLVDQIEAGINDFVINGTTAEAPTLTLEEKRRLIEIGRELISGTIIVGVSSNSTAKMIEEIKYLDDLDIDGYMVCPPYYNKTSQAGLYQHVMAITEVSERSILLYNVPSRCQMSFSLETVLKLSACPQVIGIKEASGDLNYFFNVVNQTSEDFAVFNGNDDLIVVTAKLGAAGVISAISNGYAEPIVHLNSYLNNQDYDQAYSYFQTILPVIDKTYQQVNPIGVKALAKINYNYSDYLRLPLVEAEDSYYQELRAVVDLCK
ncbi:4-hydroxy-tetrahydrodipicolinate synthase [Mollicutes bacterium LVI A0039]|nr:4-hydroxy-tetrahydrodipicolinate synthase [Mollicutes bacterium LVI A0039]